MYARAITVLVLLSVADAQPPPPLRFESASIRPIPASGGFYWDDSKAIDGLMWGKRLSGGTLRLNLVSMRTLLKLAYPEILNDEFLKAPGWIRTKGFELIAKAPPGTPADDVRMMIQSLLIERLHLAIHREPKNLQVVALIAAKSGVKLRPAMGTADAQCEKKEDYRGFTVGYSSHTSYQWTCQNVTMEYLARSLSILNSTGLQGSYDLAFQWTSSSGAIEHYNGGVVAGFVRQIGDRMELSNSLEKALGLKLEARSQRIPVIVVDHLDSH